MDNLSRSDRSKNMRSVCSKNTLPEIPQFKELKKRKIYFTKHKANVLGKPDICFFKKRIAVFVDSDFWHHNPKKYISPKSNKEYWETKILKNVERDRYVNRELIVQGWIVLRFWESSIKHRLDKVIYLILSIRGKR